MKLIDKDALVAEIERLDALYHTSKNLAGDLFIQGLFCFIDTLEVKEVDLDKEIDLVEDKYHGFESLSRTDIINITKHFFELGIAVNNKAQKGDKV